MAVDAPPQRGTMGGTLNSTGGKRSPWFLTGSKAGVHGRPSPRAYLPSMAHLGTASHSRGTLNGTPTTQQPQFAATLRERSGLRNE